VRKAVRVCVYPSRRRLHDAHVLFKGGHFDLGLSIFEHRKSLQKVKHAQASAHQQSGTLQKRASYWIGCTQPVATSKDAHLPHKQTETRISQVNRQLTSIVRPVSRDVLSVDRSPYEDRCHVDDQNTVPISSENHICRKETESKIAAEIEKLWFFHFDLISRRWRLY